MRYDGTNLEEVLEAHERWLTEEEGWGEDDKADVSRADLHGADLRRADLSGAKNVPFVPMTCPDSGAFVGWKKVRTQHGYCKYAIAKLLIAEDAKRSSATTRKCRADYVVVLELQELDGTRLPAGVEGYSLRRGEHMAVYREGEKVSADGWNEDRWDECSHGIHFFVNRQEAVEFQL